MDMSEFLAALERGAAADAGRVLARLDAAGAGARGLFIDCGSNLGQGFGQFVRHYPLARFDYVLIEPNPNCLPTLRDIVAQRGGNIEILEQAAATRSGSVRFYGLERDPLSQGGSTLKDHNSRYYAAAEDQALEVPTFDLAEMVRSRGAGYAAIVLKLDIEGAEYEVLPHMIGQGVHRSLDAAYIEFHAQYMAEPQGARYRALEAAIRERLSADGVPYRIWI